MPAPYLLLWYIRLAVSEAGYLTCHFRQPGLYDGRPLSESDAVVKIYSAWLCFRPARWCGRWLESYVMRGNLSKTRLTGCGVCSHGPGLCCGDRADCLSCSDVELSSVCRFTSCGMASIHLG